MGQKEGSMHWMSEKAMRTLINGRDDLCMPNSRAHKVLVGEFCNATAFMQVKINRGEYRTVRDYLFGQHNEPRYEFIEALLEKAAKDLFIIENKENEEVQKN
jgi:hypothetical protein